MYVTVERTKVNRMTDMYVIRFPPWPTRFVSLTKEELPDLSLERGQIAIFELVLKKKEQ